MPWGSYNVPNTSKTLLAPCSHPFFFFPSPFKKDTGSLMKIVTLLISVTSEYCESFVTYHKWIPEVKHSELQVLNTLNFGCRECVGLVLYDLYQVLGSHKEEKCLVSVEVLNSWSYGYLGVLFFMCYDIVFVSAVQVKVRAKAMFSVLIKGPWLKLFTYHFLIQ